MNFIKRQTIVRFTKCVVISIIMLILSACGVSGAQSNSISAKDLSVEMHVSNNGDEIINVEVILRNGTMEMGESVTISGNEELLVSTVGDNYRNSFDASDFESLNSTLNNVKVLSTGRGRNSAYYNSGLTWYYTQFDINQVNKEFTLIMERPSRKTSNKSVVTLPASFFITSPLAGESLSRLDDIVLTWDNTQVNASMSIIASTICISGDTQRWESGELFPDYGTHTIPANTFMDLPGVCSLTIRATRTNLGVLDPLFALGGIVLGHQIRSTVINTVP